MKSERGSDAPEDRSGMLVEFSIGEAWINQFLTKQELVVPLTKKYNLARWSIHIELDRVIAQADILEKKGSRVMVNCHPVWNSEHQHISLEDIQIEMASKNILVKGAGWFAKTLMAAKLSRKAEQAINQLFQKQIADLLEKGLQIPVMVDGRAHFKFSDVQIKEWKFRPQEVMVKVVVNGQGNLQLK